MYFIHAMIFALGLSRLGNCEFNAPTFMELVDGYCQSRGINADQELWTQRIAAIVDERLNIALKSMFASTCKDVSPHYVKSRNGTGGIFRLFPTGAEPIDMYCDTETDGGGWTVFQRRMDGSVDFKKGWSEYVEGFGDKRGEFWLGLENIHQMTSDGTYELRVDVVDRNGVHHYAKYASFRLESGSDNYRLRVSGYSGNATDSLEYHNNLQFSTHDRDNDNSGNCASYWKGAWWYNACYYSHLNGEYTGTGGKAMQWWHKINPTGWDLPSRAIFLKFSEMKFRKVE